MTPQVKKTSKTKKKTKVRPAVFTGVKQTVASPSSIKGTALEDLVNSLLRDEADSRGMTIAEYQTQRAIEIKAQKKYDEEHWVKPLLVGQIFAILTQKETKPYYYMGKPVSKTNTDVIDRYKETDKGWLEYKEKQNKNTDAFEKQKLPKAVLQSQETLKNITEQINKSVEPLRKSMETIRKFGQPLRDLKLNFGMLPPNIKLPDFPEGLLSDTRRIKAKDNGLDRYATDNDLNNGVELAEHYLKTHKIPEKMDYAVTAYDNAQALAYSVGMTPQELFKITCDHIKLRKKEYKKRIVELETGYLIEMLVNHYLSERDRHEAKGLGTLYMTNFYKSKYVQNFMKHTGLKMDYKRFDGQMNKWIKIYTSKAHKNN